LNKTTGPFTGKDEQRLMAEIWSPSISDDPLAFVMFAFPWRKTGTPLEHFDGPRAWQREVLTEIRDHIQSNKLRMELGEKPVLYKGAVSSGRGIGKSSLVAWLDLWMMSCHLGSTVINTANSEAQLTSRTWAELGKWHTLSINSHWFEKTAMSLRPTEWYEKALKTQLKIDTGYYYAQAQLWSEERPDAFAGAHNHHGLLLIFDEASGIPKPIWTVSEGFFTEPVLHRYWFCFSNPRRNIGSFYECFNANRKFWNRRTIDSRTVEGTDRNVYDEIIATHGDDSDEARVEVKGEFPRQGDKQFISRDLIEQAKAREDLVDIGSPLIMGVDPARYGDDSTVIRFRRGRDARSIKPIVLKDRDNMAVASICAELMNEHNPDAVCIDAGSGTGVIDRLKALGFNVHEIWFGSKAQREELGNRRTELWAEMRDWLGGGCIDNSEDLTNDLAGPLYDFMQRTDLIILEPKEKMKKRGLASPDHADALALTFAVKVARKDIRLSRGSKRRTASGMDYNLFGE
jgi:hypothetical protein